MLTVYLTRHGETEWNIQDRLQGSKDSNLTVKGISDAKLLSKKLTNVNFSKIYTSSSKRAIKTANILRNNALIPIVEIDDLKEIHFGDWEGKTKIQINEGFGNKFESLWKSPQLYDHRPHFGESLLDLRKRVGNVIQSILNINKEGTILIVTHAVVLATIVAHIKDSPIEKLWDIPIVHGTSLTIIELDDENHWKIELLCDINHLK